MTRKTSRELLAIQAVHISHIHRFWDYVKKTDKTNMTEELLRSRSKLLHSYWKSVTKSYLTLPWESSLLTISGMTYIMMRNWLIWRPTFDTTNFWKKWKEHTLIEQRTIAGSILSVDYKIWKDQTPARVSRAARTTERNLGICLFHADEIFAKSQEIEYGQREWSEAKSITSHRQKRNERSDRDSDHLVHLSAMKNRACMVCKEVHALSACKRFLKLSNWRRHQHVRWAGAFGVSGLIIEWRVIGPIFNVTIATIRFFIWRQQ